MAVCRCSTELTGLETGLMQLISLIFPNQAAHRTLHFETEEKQAFVRLYKHINQL